jgi:hypothetical protein
MKRAYKSVFNGLVTMKGLRGVSCFGEIDDMIAVCQNGEKLKESVEIMCHPILSESGCVIDLSGESIVDRYTQLKQFLPDIELVSYGHYAKVS